MGYQPTQNDPTTCSMKKDDIFPTTPPQPWLPPDKFPTDATSEVKAQMLKSSQVRGEHPCRKIVFSFKSHDQGWGGTREQKNTYKGSYTWFEAGKERLTAFKDFPSPKTATTRADEIAEPSDEETAEAIRPSDQQHREQPPHFPFAYPLNSVPNVIATTPSSQYDISRLPHFPFTSSTNTNSTTDSPSTICTVHTLLPPITTRQIAHSPSQTESFFTHALLPSPIHIQRNLTANRETQSHTITWRHDDHLSPVPDSWEANELEKQGRGVKSMDGEFVRGLAVGDTVTVWGKARFPMWVNTVEEVRIDVFWAV